MTAARRDWLSTFADPAVLSDLRAAARDAMRMVCNHEPEECDCPLNRATFAEWVDWVELEVARERGKPLYMRPAGQPNRKRVDPRFGGEPVHSGLTCPALRVYCSHAGGARHPEHSTGA